MGTTITIKNCNCISEAKLYLEDNALNIKYGQNGTGKSTFCKAIDAKASADEMKLKELRPYSIDEGDKDNQPYVSDIPYNKISVFDESYVNRYMFQNDNGFHKDSFKVFLRSEECENLKAEIDKLLGSLQNAFNENDDLKNLSNFLPRLFTKVSFDKNGNINERGGIGEFLKGQGCGFENHSEIDSYKPYYENKNADEVSDWASWRIQGNKIIEKEKEICPYCAGSTNPTKIGIENQVIANVFKNSALEAAKFVLDFVRNAIEYGYIEPDTYNVINGYIGITSKKEELTSEINSLSTETNYLNNKINTILSFRPMNVTREQIANIQNTLDNMVIDKRQLSKFYKTESITNLIDWIDTKIEDLKTNTGKLRGLFNRYDDKLQKLIDSRKEDINTFFTLAGFPYKFEIEGNGENKASTYLIPTGMSEEHHVDKPDSHLSWGERNAFSLVMFMFQAVSDGADLVVLDDPITSFDKEKKFAVIKRLFEKGKDSFHGKTVLMLTHDLQPIIDYVYGDFFESYNLGKKVSAMRITNVDGIVEEDEIHKEDLKNTIELAKGIAKCDDYPLATRIVNLRKYVEITNSGYKESPIYEILSNIIHGRETATDKQGNELSEMVINEGMKALNEYIPDLSYNNIINELSNEKLMEISTETEEERKLYNKVISIRLLFERNGNLLKKLRKEHPEVCKFVNETNHIENDYIFQLDPFKFYDIPKEYMDKIDAFLQDHISEIDV